MIVTFELNGKTVYTDANPGERLVHILRKLFNLLSAKEGCLSGRCGSCTVLFDGNPVPSCIIPVFHAHQANIVTIEAFSRTADYADIATGFHSAGVQLCGFCDAGKIFAAHSLLQKNTRPSKDEIKSHFALTACRCSGIEEIITGIKYAGELRRKRGDAQ